MCVDGPRFAGEGRTPDEKQPQAGSVELDGTSFAPTISDWLRMSDKNQQPCLFATSIMATQKPVRKTSRLLKAWPMHAGFVTSFPGGGYGYKNGRPRVL
mmetsp:Transcript_281/g.367  ORF Transcript_281/g.367 Transcript_281/m.367 type:complete len:99 (-) Transcript_281:621-917(-)